MVTKKEKKHRPGRRRGGFCFPNFDGYRTQVPLLGEKNLPPISLLNSGKSMGVQKKHVFALLS